MQCAACDNDQVKLILSHELYLCSECRSSSSGKLLSKSDAKQKYILNDKDLKDLKTSKYKNTTYGTHVTLYLIKDLEKAAIEKHGSLDKLKELLDAKNIKKQKKQELALNLKQSREKELEEHLVSIGVGKIRSDSVLCSKYIEKGDQSGYTISQIGDILKEMKFFYENTDYNSILQELRQDDYEYSGFRHIDPDEEEDRRVSAKEKALENYVKKNYLNMHKLIEEVPYSLKDKATRIGAQYYEKNNKNKIKNINTQK